METTDARIRAIADRWTQEHARGGWFARTDLEYLLARLGEVETALSGVHQAEEDWIRIAAKNADDANQRLAAATQRADQAEAALAEAKLLNDELSDALTCALEERPMANGQYPHLLYCNGPRNVPAGTRGVTCNCNCGAARTKAAEAALTAVRQAQEWQPIETAQKHGRILCWDGLERFIANFNYKHEQFGQYYNAGRRWVPALFWLPLPDPPCAPVGGRGSEDQTKS